MVLSLDYDNTFTRDPLFWTDFLEMCHRHGHVVYGVTMRYESEKDDMDPRYLNGCYAVVFTSRQFKKDFCKKHGLNVDVWVDDMPEALYDPALSGLVFLNKEPKQKA